MRRSLKVEASGALSVPLLRTFHGQFKITSLPLGDMHIHRLMLLMMSLRMLSEK
jgi:hypothetical protein